MRVAPHKGSDCEVASRCARPMAAAAAAPMNGGAPLHVKAKHGAELARLTVPAAELSVDGLGERLRRSFGLSNGGLRLKFVDDEGDLCRLSTAEDLLEALRLRVDPAPLRLEVAFTSQAPSATPTAAEAPAAASSDAWDRLGAAAPPGGIPAGGLPTAGIKRETAAGVTGGGTARKRPRRAVATGDGTGDQRTTRAPGSASGRAASAPGSPPRSPHAVPDDAVVAAVFTQRDSRRYTNGQSPWVRCSSPFVKIHIKIVAHKTQPLPASELAAGEVDAERAEPDLFTTTPTLNTLSKVARHLGCDVSDLVHLNDQRYPRLTPSVVLQNKTLLLQPFRARVIAGLLVAYRVSRVACVCFLLADLSLTGRLPLCARARYAGRRRRKDLPSRYA